LFDLISVSSSNIQKIMSENFKQYICVVCGLIYDEAEGWPDDGIEAGTRWDEVPDTWTCPDCGVTKDDFELLED
jgi:rubredoxin